MTSAAVARIPVRESLLTEAWFGEDPSDCSNVATFVVQPPVSLGS